MQKYGNHPGPGDSGIGGREMTAIRAISYKESRLDHFKALRERRRKTLHWWKYQKPYKQYDQQTIWEMCADLGNEISYLDDVIEMLEKQGVEE